MNFIETEEQTALRAAVSQLGHKYAQAYALPRLRSSEPLDELWAEAGALGYLGVSLPEESAAAVRGFTSSPWSRRNCRRPGAAFC